MKSEPRDVWRGWQGVAVRVAVYVVLLIVGAIVLIPRTMTLGVIVWLTFMLGGLLWLVRWHARSFVYQCPYPDCGRIFAISTFIDLVSPQWVSRRGGLKYLRCPSCGRRGWARMISRASVAGTGQDLARL